MPGEEWIRLARPWMDERELEAAAEVFSSGRLVSGPRGREFEDKIKNIVGVKHAVALNSGTMALYALLKSIGLGHSDEVIVPALTFPAAAECTIMAGARPVLVDVSRSSFNLDPALVANAITESTRVIVAVDQFGVPANYPEIEKVIKDRDIVLIEDAACALGSSMNGKPCGAFGKAAILSFHPRKIITTGEGGMVLTNDGDLAAGIEKLRNHGRDGGGGFQTAGLNLRMGEIEAALGLVQLTKLEDILLKRKRIADLYAKYLSGVLGMQQVPEGGECNHQTFAVVLPDGADEEARDGIIREMHEKKIELQVASYNLARIKPYAGLAGDRIFPVAEMIHNRGIALPIHPLMEEADARAVCERLEEAVEKRNM